nr:uncharacterized protein LOC109754918 [Aegilops tauschii subsp. strangulata]
MTSLALPASSSVSLATCWSRSVLAEDAAARSSVSFFSWVAESAMRASRVAVCLSSSSLKSCPILGIPLPAATSPLHLPWDPSRSTHLLISFRAQPLLSVDPSIQSAATHFLHRSTKGERVFPCLLRSCSHPSPLPRSTGGRPHRRQEVPEERSSSYGAELPYLNCRRLAPKDASSPTSHLQIGSRGAPASPRLTTSPSSATGQLAGEADRSTVLLPRGLEPRATATPGVAAVAKSASSPAIPSSRDPSLEFSPETSVMSAQGLLLPRSVKSAAGNGLHRPDACLPYRRPSRLLPLHHASAALVVAVFLCF